MEGDFGHIRVSELLRTSTVSLEDWRAFYDWCRKKHPLWAPDYATAKLWEQWKKEVVGIAKDNTGKT